MSNFMGNKKIVVVQLSGGNDYLNCIIPYTNSEYLDNRPNVRITEEKVLPIGGGLGMNPSMAPIKELFDDGKVAAQKGKLEDTIINPEFRGMLSNGHIPMKKNGKPDGSEFGALLKTKWWPPWDSDWLSKKERISLGRDENGDPIDDSP